MSGGIGGGESGVPETLLDTKGQVHGFTTTNAAVNVGANDTIIYADSAQAAGIGYGASAKSTLATTGSLLAASSANTLSELSASATSGHVLTSTGAASLPTYQAVASGGQIELIGTATAGVPTGRKSNWLSGTLTPEPNMETTYSELIVIANLYYDEATGFGECYINLNSTTSGYGDAHGFYYDGSSNTNLSKSNGTVAFITDANLGESTNEGIHTYTSIALNDATTFMYNFHTYSTSSSGTSMILDTTCDLASNTIDHVKLQASLASWATDSNITIYGRKMI